MNDYATWRVGQRVSRKQDSSEHGTVVSEDTRNIKVKWDNGRTSYFKRDEEGNVRTVDRNSN